MFDLGTLGAAYALLHATHGIADYWIQRDWQANAKSKKGLLPWTWADDFATPDLASYALKLVGGKKLKWIGWNKAVLSHAVEYALCFIPALWLLDVRGWELAAYVFAIFLPHAWMDTRQFLMWFCHKTKGWNVGDLDWGFDTKNGLVSEDDAYQTVDSWANHRGRISIPEAHFYKAAVRVHVSIHMDQKFHYACLLGIALARSWRP